MASLRPPERAFLALFESSLKILAALPTRSFVHLRHASDIRAKGAADAHPETEGLLALLEVPCVQFLHALVQARLHGYRVVLFNVHLVSSRAIYLTVRAAIYAVLGQVLQMAIACLLDW